LLAFRVDVADTCTVEAEAEADKDIDDEAAAHDGIEETAVAAVADGGVSAAGELELGVDEPLELRDRTSRLANGPPRNNTEVRGVPDTTGVDADEDEDEAVDGADDADATEARGEDADEDATDGVEDGEEDGAEVAEEASAASDVFRPGEVSDLVKPYESRNARVVRTCTGVRTGLLIPVDEGDDADEDEDEEDDDDDDTST
jgi:hypothetical protein